MRITGRQFILLCLGILAIGGVVRGVFFYQHLHEPLNLTTDLVFEVEPGTTFTQLVDDFSERGILSHGADLELHARLSRQAQRIKAGEYLLSLGSTPISLLEMLVQGDINYHQLILLEGWTLAQALAAIQADPAVRKTLEPGDDQALRDLFGTDFYPEGLVFPDTYNFNSGATDQEMLLRGHRLMQEILEEEWQNRASDLPFEEPYEALILASLVEKEAALAAERGPIAGVFVRRLRRGMRLQSDPTVIYGLGDRFDGNLTRAHLREDGPYNTYARAGLPPTPIALPGRDAISASLHPEPGDALYFVARGDGSHHFSSTLEEHNRAVRQYQSGSR